MLVITSERVLLISRSCMFLLYMLEPILLGEQACRALLVLSCTCASAVAVKANPVGKVLQQFRDRGMGAEVCFSGMCL
jgi:hypothetical protein